MPRGSPSKYQPLVDHLAAQPATVASLALTPAEVEALLGGPLPASAHGPSWWSPSDRHHTRQWRRVGWRARTRTVAGQVVRVTFERLAPR